ncbi:phage major capsid protein [Acinetobacter sp. YH12138]|uniref:phage major capsid protein n=1 Tax=Acinetobacter sp. YH12138 TaxID=2601122 RepID=UPI0015D155F4|nr:phage major capsid protein [Acinetobacter sp. YH12138]QOW49259.1 phage major capsid protein [Acinetobacter sp. YH12138]
MKLAEQIAKLKANIKSHQDQIVVKSGASISKGVTPDEATEAEIKGLQDEIAVMQKNQDRLEAIQKSQAALADTTTPVDGSTSEKGLNSTQGKTVVKTESNLPKGHGIAMIVRAKVASQQLAKNHSEYVSASDLLKSWNAPEIVQNVAKAVAGTTSSDEYSALIQTQNLVNDFMDVMRPQTIIGRIKGFREVPFNITVPTKTSGSIVNWVGEGKKKPVTNLVIGKTSLSFAKIAGIVPFSDELALYTTNFTEPLSYQDSAFLKLPKFP